MKKLTYFMVATVFLGAQLFAIDIGIMKISMFRISLILVGIGFLLSVLQNNSNLRFYPNKLSSLYVIFFGIWLIYGIISIIWAANLSSWIRANYFIGVGFISIFTIHQFIKTKKDLIGLLKIIAGALFFHVMIGFLEIITGYYHFADMAKLDRYNTFTEQPMTRIPISTFANQNDYATMLTAGIFLTYILFSTVRKIRWKAAYGLLMVATLYLIYRTDSRANILGLAIGFLFIALVKYFEVFNPKRVVIAVSSLSVVGGFIYLTSDSVQSSLNSVLLTLLDTSNLGGYSNSNRLNLIRNGFMFLASTLGIGVGAGNIEYWMENYTFFKISGTFNMHNWWMEILTGYGLMIFMMYVTLYILLIVKFYQYYRWSTDSFIKSCSIALIGYLGAFILASVSSSGLLISEWQWVIFGIIVAILGYCNNHKEKALKKITNLQYQRLWRME